MSNFFVKINREKIEIDEDVFSMLLELSPIETLTLYKNAIKDKEISFINLKELARRADIPYPLFFAPKIKVNAQIKDKNKIISTKFSAKSEVQLGYRGKMKNGDIELIIKDFAQKQEFLKKRVLINEKDNPYIGSVESKIKKGASVRSVAEYIRRYFEIDLTEMRKTGKKSVVKYLSKKIENKNIFVSFSSYNFMPQNIDKNLNISGICIKDKKFPFVFINTRDGDEKPLILETDGRQIFSIVSMMVCIGMNRFILNTKKGLKKSASYRLMYKITGEVLVPEDEIRGMTIASLDEIKELCGSFRVTPSMLLFRLREVEILTKKEVLQYSKMLKDEIRGAKNTPHQPTLLTGYSKYNGERFSKEIMHAYDSRIVTPDEVRHLLFRKNKMNINLFQEYLTKFK